MTHDLRVTLLQADLHWEDPVANRAMFEEMIWSISGGTDMIILPEMFTTGFTMNTSLAEMMGMDTFRWMKQMAGQTGALLIGSYIVREKNNFFNRLLWMEPDGKFQTYDKHHLFSMAGEDKSFTAGTTRLIGTWKGWKICPMICYDLRFPEWSRNRYDKKMDSLDYDLLVFVANWPASRSSAWDSLLKARAIENLSYVVGVNRVGRDGLDLEYNGDSIFSGPKGETLLEMDKGASHSTMTVSHEKLKEFRMHFPSYKDQD